MRRGQWLALGTLLGAMLLVLAWTTPAQSQKAADKDKKEGSLALKIARGAKMSEQEANRFLQALGPAISSELAAGKTVNLPGLGTFHNRDVQLTWIGRSERNGQACAVIDYRAFFNPLAIANDAITLKGRSHYWGTIWVSLATRQIEYATLDEDVLGELTVNGQGGPRTISVLRSGVFEPVVAR